MKKYRVKKVVNKITKEERWIIQERFFFFFWDKSVFSFPCSQTIFEDEEEAKAMVRKLEIQDAWDW